MSGGSVASVATAARKAPGAPATVAEFIAAQIDMSDKTQREIALAIGYDKPNIVTMFKQGLTKIPLNKVAPLAKVLGIDPVHLLRVVLREYQPDMWASINECLGRGGESGSLATKNEAAMLEVIRKATGEADPEMSPGAASQLRAWAKSNL